MSGHISYWMLIIRMVLFFSEVDLGDALQNVLTGPSIWNYLCLESVVIVLLTSIIVVAMVGLLVLVAPDLQAMVWEKKRRRQFNRRGCVKLSIEESGEQPPDPRGILATVWREDISRDRNSSNGLMHRATLTLLTSVIASLIILHRRTLSAVVVEVLCSPNQVTTRDDNLKYRNPEKLGVTV